MPVIRSTLTDRQPSLRVCWLGLRNTLRRWPLVGPAFVLALVVLGALVVLTPAKLAVAAAAAHPLAVLLITGLLFVMMIYRRRRLLVRHRHRDWLAALPSDVPLSVRAAYLPFVGWICAAFTLLGAAAFSNIAFVAAANVIFASAAGLLAAIATVASATALQRRTELRRPGRRRPSRLEPAASQYAVVRRPRAGWATRATLIPLGYWPTAQTRFWDRPKRRARGLLPLLLAMPLDVGAGIALLAGALWLITMHLVNLLAAVVRTAFAAAWWLAPTPLGAARFAFALSHRALVGEVLSCALLVFVVTWIGGAHAFAGGFELAVMWIGAACAVSAAACLMALRRKSIARSPVHRWIH